MATTTYFLRKGKRHSVIYVIYRHLDKSKLFSTNIKIDPAHWIESKQKIDLTSGIKATKINETLLTELKKESSALNAKINLIRSKLTDIATRLELASISPTVERVSLEFLGRESKKQNDVNSLIKEYLKNCKVNKAPGTYKQIQSGLKTFQEFAREKKYNLTFDVFSLKLYDTYTSYLFDQGLNNNTTGGKVKVLKTFLNWLKNYGYPVNPEFEKYKVFKDNPQIVYLTQKELQSLSKKKFKKPHLDRTRDIFIFQCHTGLRISDLMRLDEEHIRDGVIQMRAYKTKSSIYIPLTPEAQQLLKKYDGQIPKLADQVYNRQLKEMAHEAGLKRMVEVTDFKGGQKIFKKVPLHDLVKSHTARKTFITMCIEKGLQPKIVASMTGISLKILIDNYYGVDQDNIKRVMSMAFGNPKMKVS